jgi:hypothetical protein
MRGEDSEGTQAIIPTVFDLGIFIVVTGVFCHCFQSSVLIIPNPTNLRTPALHICIASPDSYPKSPKTNRPNNSSLLLNVSLHH